MFCAKGCRPHGRKPVRVDLEQFLAELNDGDNGGLVPQEYACHFAQVAFLLGSSEIQLSCSGDWVEWSCNGRALDESSMRAIGSGELLMAEPDLCLNLCLQCLVLSDYAEKIFCSGGRQLIHQGAAGWKLRQTDSTGTRLQLKVAWKSRVKNFLRSPRNLPELDLLAPRLAGSHLKLNTTQTLEKERASCILRVQGQAPLSQNPPMWANEVVRFEYPGLEGSFWLYLHGQDCHTYVRGLGYPTPPFLPGRMWLSLGHPHTDPGHRQLLHNEDFQRACWQMLGHLSSHLREWLDDKRLQRFGVEGWLLHCLLSVRHQEGAFQQALAELPLFSTQSHGKVSLLEIDREVPGQGCHVIAESCLEEFEEKPLLLVSEHPLLLDYLRSRYPAVQSGSEVLQQLRERKERQKLWKQAQSLDLDALKHYPFSWPLELPGWRGRIGFDPELASSSLDCYRGGRLLLRIPSSPMLMDGFYVLADHPDWEPDEHWREPQPGPPWDELLAYLKHNQTRWLAQIAGQLPPGLRARLVWRALDNHWLDPTPLMKVPVEENPALTPERWLSDGSRADLRAWLETRNHTPVEMRNFLVKHLGQAVAEKAFECSALYATSEGMFRLQPEEPIQLPGEHLVELEKPFPMRLGLGLNQDLQFRLYREGRLLSSLTRSDWPGLAPGLLVAAESSQFRLTLDTLGFDFASPGFLSLLTAVQQALPEICLAALESEEPELRPVVMGVLEIVDPVQWPARAALFSRLNGTPVHLHDLRQTTSARVLVGAAARVPLPGFEDCWCLNPEERAWLEKLLPIILHDETREYNESYRESRYKIGDFEPIEELFNDWFQPQRFKQGNLRARAGLVEGSAPAHLCETTFCRGGRAALRCPLVLSAARPVDAPRHLVCRVDWDDLPFIEDFSQLRALPEVAALVEWLRRYAFDPPLVCHDYQLARLEGEFSPGWSASQDPFVVCLARARVWGGASLRDLQEREEILWGEEAEAPIQLEPSTQARLQFLVPGCDWRHWKAPDPGQAFLDDLLQQSPRQPALTRESFLSSSSRPGCVWGVAWNLSGPSQVRLLYQGRPAGVLEPAWDIEVEAEIEIPDLRLSATGEPRLTATLKRHLSSLWSEIQSALLREKSRSSRIHLALFCLSRGQVPDWAGALLGTEQLGRWWSLYSPPRPFVLDGASLEGVPQLPAPAAEWAEARGIALQNCTDYARKLAGAPENLRPPHGFYTEGPGFYLSTFREARQALVRNVSEGRVLEQKEHPHFPPYYLERQYDRWKAPGPLPPGMFQRLWKWWNQQLDADPRTLGWLADFEMEKAAPGAEELLERARKAVAAWQELQQDEWTLLRQALQLVSPTPLRLVLCDQGPLLQRNGNSVRLNRRLSGPAGRHTVLRLLNHVCLELPEARPIPWVLHQLK